ncbi:MAG: hypothetical protein ACK5X3_06975 [Pseudomonadota bacterium]|jgi:hypothetical protein
MGWNKDDWKKLVGAVAPGLATALGGCRRCGVTEPRRARLVVDAPRP